AEILGPGIGQVNEGVEVGGFSARWSVKRRHYTHDKLPIRRAKRPRWSIGSASSSVGAALQRCDPDT
ncbi:MAG: hypothetical protein WAK21_03085, partial [Candidatus Sulfotelmatobacter sp.]